MNLLFLMAIWGSSGGVSLGRLDGDDERVGSASRMGVSECDLGGVWSREGSV